MKPARRRTPSSARVLVFGESKNDVDSIKHLLIHANPALEGSVYPSLRPVSLTRTAQAAAVDRWISQIDAVVSALKRRHVAVRALIVHRDADGPDPSGTVERQLAAQLSRVNGIPVVPVQMLEAWWFLFPDAVEAVRPQAWHDALPRSHRDVEGLNDPKKALKRLTRGTKHEYSEADSPAIAQVIREQNPERWGRSASYDRMVAVARSL